MRMYESCMEFIKFSSSSAYISSVEWLDNSFCTQFFVIAKFIDKKL